MRVFLAGATGSVGFEFAQLAKAQGHYLHTLSRSPENARKLAGLADRVDLQDACAAVPILEEIDVVVSALGAPITMRSSEKRRYGEVDLPANTKLLEAARAARVRRFVYVSVHVEVGYRDTAYIRAHETFVEMLRHSGLSYSLIRPTGIFPALRDFMDMAQKGLGTVVGNGMAHTNPVHQADVAKLLLENLDSGAAEISIGGPDIFTRREIAELAFHVLGKRPRIMRLPAAVLRAGAAVAGIVNPRVGELLEFATAVSTTECVAPRTGQLRLEDYFGSLRTATTHGS